MRGCSRNSSRHVNVLPCFVYTPPSWGVAPKTSAPPAEPQAYADFLDLMITRFGKHFEWVELWNEPNNLRALGCNAGPVLVQVQRDGRRRRLLGEAARQEDGARRDEPDRSQLAAS